MDIRLMLLMQEAEIICEYCFLNGHLGTHLECLDLAGKHELYNKY